MGGAVQGGRYYGTAPEIANNGADDMGQGRLLPSRSVDQYAATLGRWLGISDADLLTELPHLGHWQRHDYLHLNKHGWQCGVHVGPVGRAVPGVAQRQQPGGPIEAGGPHDQHGRGGGGHAAGYAATLGRWFGIGDTDLLTVLPQLGQ